MSEDQVIFYHSPRTRSSGVLTLLEELDAPYELRTLNFLTGEQRREDYLSVNPTGKVPAIFHNGALVTEQVAVFIYLADAFPQKRLAPPIGEPLRGAYLRWLVYYGSAFEPAIVDRAMKREPARPSMSPYGDYDSVMKLIDGQLAQGPFLFGERFTAADILWGVALNWTVGFGLVTATPSISAFVERVTSRDAFKRVLQTDGQLMKIHEAAAGNTR